MCLSDVIVGFVGDWVGESWNGDLLRNFPEFSQLGRQFGKEALEADSRVKRVHDPGMVGMKLIRDSRSVARDVARFEDYPAPQRSCSLGCGT